MKNKLKRALRIMGVSGLLIFSVFLLLLFSGVIWRSPAYYEISSAREFEQPVMSMEEYAKQSGHVRPYNFHLKKNTGEVYVLGIDHTKDIGDPQIDSIEAVWKKFKPDVVLVEGRLGFLFSGLQDPVKMYGEGGKAISLAKKDEVEFYTWEPKKQDEVNMMVKRFSPEKVAFFYSLRPYLSNFRYGKPEHPEKKMKSYVKSRTDYDKIRGLITSVSQIDSMWVKDYPASGNWRDSSDEYGWPDGYLSEMAAYSNQLRNIHMCSAILELVEQGKKVFITMGSSHAFRIEGTLRQEFNQPTVSLHQLEL